MIFGLRESSEFTQRKLTNFKSAIGGTYLMISDQLKPLNGITKS